jgi:hypothetical protein
VGWIMRRGIRKIKQLFHLEIFDFFSSPVRDRDEEERQMGRQRRGSAALEIALPPWRSLCRPGNRSAALEIAGDRSAALEIALPPRRSLCRPGNRSAALEIALPPWKSLCRPGNRSAAQEIALPPWKSLCRPGDHSAAQEITLPPWKSLCRPGVGARGEC